MKKIQDVLIMISVLLIPLMAAQGFESYEDDFLNPGSDAPLTNANWNANIGTNGTVYTGSSGTTGPILSGASFIFHRPASTAGGTPVLAWTEEAGVSQAISQVTNLAMTLRNTIATEDVKFAIRVDGDWYVSQDAFNSPTEVTTPVSLAVQAAGWNELDFTADSILAEGSSVSLPSSGTMTAVGIFDASTTASMAIRADDFQIYVEMAAEDLIFDEEFPNPGSDAPLASISWNANVGTNGTAYMGSAGSGGPVLSSQDYVFHRPASGAEGSPVFAWTEKDPVSVIGDISSDITVVALLRNDNVSENLQLAIRVETNWFVAQEPVNVSVAGTAVSVGINVQESNWNSLDFIEGSILSEGGATNLPASGAVTAIGFFDAATSGDAIRFDDFQVYVPDSYGAWIVAYGMSGSDIDLLSDPDSDRMNNLIEYALGGNPTNIDRSAVWPSAELVDAAGTNWLEYVYFRRLDAEDRGLTYDLLHADQMVGSVWTNSGIIEVGSAAVDADFEVVTNRLSTADHNSQFLKLDVGVE